MQVNPALSNDYDVITNHQFAEIRKDRETGQQTLFALKSFKKDDEFYAGTHEQVMLNYMTAKHEFKNWYTKDKLDKLIKDLNAGKSFEEAYVQ